MSGKKKKKKKKNGGREARNNSSGWQNSLLCAAEGDIKSLFHITTAAEFQGKKDPFFQQKT